MMRRVVVHQALHVLLLIAPIVFTRLAMDDAALAGFVAMMILSIGESALHATERDVPFVDRILGFVTGVSLLLLVWNVLFGEAPARRLGLVFVALGIGLRLVALRSLGRGFRTDARPLVSIRADGVYRLRHPSEIGLILLGLGLATLRGRAGFLVFLVGLVPASFARIVREETCIYDARQQS